MDPVREVLAAVRFAAERHSRQRRKGIDAEPYVNHLIEVADLLARASGPADPQLVMAGVLHDTIEDAGVTLAELEERFGPVVAALVAEVTDDKKLEKAERKRLQVENAPRLSRRAQAIGLADKISNVRSVLEKPPFTWTLNRRREYIAWAGDVVAGFQEPNPFLLAEFRRLVALWDARGRR